MIHVMNKEIEKIANDLLINSESIQLASVCEDGFPRICEMEKIRGESFLEIAFVTFKNSEKVKHFAKNNKVSIGYSDDNNSVSLMGYIEMYEIEKIKEIIKNSMIHERWFNKNQDGNYAYCLLIFKTKKAKVFIQQKHWYYEK